MAVRYTDLKTLRVFNLLELVYPSFSSKYIQPLAFGGGGCYNTRCSLRGEVKNLPNIKSAMKRVKVNQKKNLRNRMIKSAMKTQIKKFDTAVAANEADAKLLSVTQGAVDRAAAKGVIHKNAANRKKARLAKRLAKAAQ